MVIQKRGYLFFAVFTLVFASFLRFVSAVSPFGLDLRRSIEVAIGTLKDVFSPIFETLFGQYSTYDFFWTKVLFFVLLIVLIRFAILKIPQFEKKKGIATIISLVVSLLSVRFLSESDVTETLLLPYSVLGIAIIVILPFLIFFYFLHVSNFGPGGRKIGWIVFGVVFAVLWYNRSDVLSPIGNQIYFWCLVAVVIVMFFDKQIHEYFGLAEDAKYRRDKIKLRIADIEAQLARYYSIPHPSAHVTFIIDKLEEQRKELVKKL